VALFFATNVLVEPPPLSACWSKLGQQTEVPVADYQH
jgi:hypothetical protein